MSKSFVHIPLVAQDSLTTPDIAPVLIICEVIARRAVLGHSFMATYLKYIVVTGPVLPRPVSAPHWQATWQRCVEPNLGLPYGDAIEYVS